MGLSHHVLILQFVRQAETIRLTCLMSNQRLDTQILSALEIAHYIFSVSIFLTSILLSYPHLYIIILIYYYYLNILLSYPHVFGSHSIYMYVTIVKHHYKFNLQLIFLCVVGFKFFFRLKSMKYFHS